MPSSRIRLSRLLPSRRRNGSSNAKASTSDQPSSSTPTSKVIDDTAASDASLDPQPYGLKVVAEGLNPVVDIVAVHGLDGHRDKTWTADNDVHWLRDLLPNDIPDARILCWGYDANTRSGSRVSSNYIYDHGRALVSELCLNRKRSKSTERPIIFIGYSLGGIVLKSALIHSDGARQDALEEHRSIKVSTHGIIFLGTPHQGANGVQVGKLLVNIISVFTAADDRILRNLERDSEWLQQQQGQYGSISGDFITKFAYEEYETPTVLGRSVMVVPRVSAVVPGHANAEPIVIHANHIDMVKYKSEQDPGYHTISGHLSIMVKDAAGRIQKRWEMERRMNNLRSNTPAIEKGHFLVPFGRNEAFVGRDTILDPLLNFLPPSAHPQDCQRSALEGLGGIGKTQIALEAAYRVHDAYPDCSVFWVPAVDRASFNKAYRAIGQALGVKGLDDDKADIRMLVHAALARDDVGSWLLIVDNADDQELLFGEQGILKLPFNLKGSILVTTRNHDVAIQLDIHSLSLWNVEAMSRPESIKLLCQGLGEGQIQDTINTDALLDFLADLPLAVKQASAYIAKKHITTARYLTYCKSSNETLIKLLSNDFGDRGRHEATRNPVATTWLISFEHIARDTPLAADYLRFISFFSAKNIPRVLLPEDNELEADDALGTLKSYAFIIERTDSGSFDIHRLVQLAMRNWLADKGELAAWLTRVIKRLDEVYPSPEHENREIWMSYLPHTQATLETRAETKDENTKSHLLHKVGLSFFSLGQFTVAEAMYRQALELRIKVLGAEHSDTLTSMSDIGVAQDGQGRYAEAEAIHRQVLELKTKLLGAEHPNTLASLSYIGFALNGQGRYKEAEVMYRQVLELRTKVLGAEHLDTLTSMSNIGSTLVGQGRYTEAEAIYRKTLELRTKVLGAEHPETLVSISNAAISLDGQGRYAEAEAMHRQVFELMTKVLGAEHPATLTSMSYIGSVLNGQGRYQAAEVMHRQVLELETKLLGAEHPNTLSSMSYIGSALNGQGRYQEAEVMHRQVLELETKLLGAKHPATLTSISNAAISLDGQGRYAEAEAMHRQVFELMTKVLGAEHPDTLISMSNVALTLGRQGQYTEAEVMHRQVLELKTKLLGAEHPNTLASLSYIGFALNGQGRYKEAEVMYRQVLELETKLLGAKHPATLTSMNNVASTLNKQGRYIEAEAIHRKTLKLRTKMLGAEHPDTLISMSNVALTIGRQGQYTEAEMMYRQVLKLETKMLGAEHPSTLLSMNNIASALNEQGRYIEAKAMLSKTLELHIKILGAEHPSTLICMNNVAVTLDRHGQYAEAKAMYRQVLELRTKVLGAEHPDTLTSIEDLAAID